MTTVQKFQIVLNEIWKDDILPYIHIFLQYQHNLFNYFCGHFSLWGDIYGGLIILGVYMLILYFFALFLTPFVKIIFEPVYYFLDRTVKNYKTYYKKRYGNKNGKAIKSVIVEFLDLKQNLIENRDKIKQESLSNKKNYPLEISSLEDLKKSTKTPVTLVCIPAKFALRAMDNYRKLGGQLPFNKLWKYTWNKLRYEILLHNIIYYILYIPFLIVKFISRPDKIAASLIEIYGVLIWASTAFMVIFLPVAIISSAMHTYTWSGFGMDIFKTLEIRFMLGAILYLNLMIFQRYGNPTDRIMFIKFRGGYFSFVNYWLQYIHDTSLRYNIRLILTRGAAAHEYYY